MVVFGFLQLSFAITEKQKLYHVVHYAVQAGSLTNNDRKIIGAIETYYEPSAITVSIESRSGETNQVIASSSRRYNDKITVKINRNFTLAVPFLNIDLSELSATASARIICNENRAPYDCE